MENELIITALDHAFSLLKKQELHWKRRAQEMKDFTARSEKYEARAAEVTAVLSEIAEAIDLMEDE